MGIVVLGVNVCPGCGQQGAPVWCSVTKLESDDVRNVDVKSPPKYSPPPPPTIAIVSADTTDAAPNSRAHDAIQIRRYFMGPVPPRARASKVRALAGHESTEELKRAM